MLLKDCNLEDIVANFHQSIFVSDHEGMLSLLTPWLKFCWEFLKVK